jgi:hypothetical protein
MLLRNNRQYGYGSNSHIIETTFVLPATLAAKPRHCVEFRSFTRSQYTLQDMRRCIGRSSYLELHLHLTTILIQICPARVSSTRKCTGISSSFSPVELTLFWFGSVLWPQLPQPSGVRLIEPSFLRSSAATNVAATRNLGENSSKPAGVYERDFAVVLDLVKDEPPCF